ncbi:MAG: Fur family transcriptional regulator [Candidatus Hodarchaeales archaeon]|jgi:Fur family peroxide stress response transcriptional regulator
MTEEIEVILRNQGFKVTPQRVAICKFILSNKNHPSVDDIYLEMKKNYPSMSMATVYKTVSMLAELNLITELTFKGQYTRYDPNKSLHVNVICPKCSKILDYESENVELLWETIEKELKGELLNKRIDVQKFCHECA